MTAIILALVCNVSEPTFPAQEFSIADCVYGALLSYDWTDLPGQGETR